MQLPDLPVRGVLPQVAQALAAGRPVVLQAPPGTGKTLLTAPFLLENARWLDGRKIILLEPRRLAARMAAQSMARLFGESAGETVGYSMRLERAVGPRTRIEVVTEGLLARRLLNDPELDDVGLVIFDEFHERSLNADFGLALTLDAKSILRPDLRLLVMSATIDAAATARMLGDDTAVVSAEARVWPVETILSQRPLVPQTVAEGVAAAALRALDETSGDILAFLPGESEIRRAASILAEKRLPRDILVMPLFGALDKREQDRAVAPAPPGCRKVVLATSIAESSLTIPGISVVIDCGWSRVSRFSAATGMSRLETVRVTRDRADQRRGRAGRLGPGRCYRLWDKATDAALLAESPPEIINADLASVRLDAAGWGVADANGLPWPTLPPEHSWRKAGSLLSSLGAIDGDGKITPRGRRMLRVPAHPRLAHAINVCSAEGCGREAAICAAIVEEAPAATFLRGEDDLGWIFAQVAGGGEASAESPLRADWVSRVRRIARQWTPRPSSGFSSDVGAGCPSSGFSSDVGAVPRQSVAFSPGRFLALAFPDRIAQCRDSGALYRLVDGHGAKVRPDSRLFGEKMVVAAELQDGAADAVVRLGAAIDPVDVETALDYLVATEDSVVWDSRKDRIAAFRRRKIGALVLDEAPLASPPEGTRLAAFADGIARHGVANLGWTRQSRSLQARILFLRRAFGEDGRWPDVSDEALAADIPGWLGFWLADASSWGDILKIDLSAPLLAKVGGARELDALAPEHLALPCGHRARIDYTQGDTPLITAKLQDFFGLKTTPLLAGGRAKTKICLLSPAQRPVAITDDLANFWREGYLLVRKEMRGRYPKHNWPENP